MNMHTLLASVAKCGRRSVWTGLKKKVHGDHMSLWVCKLKSETEELKRLVWLEWIWSNTTVSMKQLQITIIDRATTHLTVANSYIWFCLSVCLFVCLFVCPHDNSKTNEWMHMTSVTVRHMLPCNVTSSSETIGASFWPQTDHLSTTQATTTSTRSQTS